MNHNFFQQIEAILAAERLDAYRRDAVPPAIALARYLWNMALCESLYPPLQMAEIALRNSIHHFLSARLNTPAWYDSITGLPPWQHDQLADARQTLLTAGKSVAPGGMVAELHFGFWTGFFNKHHARTGLGHALAAQVFPHAPRTERDLRKLDVRWKHIRDLRNRVFHHERIIHWTDLDAQHAALLQVIQWASPELQQMAVVLDRYTSIRRQGLNPWLERLRRYWPDPAAAPPALAAGLAVVPAAFDATQGAASPFGHRWGGDVFTLSDEHLRALQNGQALALDVQNEYIAFLKYMTATKPEPAEDSKPKENVHAG